ncbi:MAG: Gfo/Idh/MocA family protein [Verrucomicrobiales bacterium]
MSKHSTLEGPIHVAVIGAGAIGINHIQNLQLHPEAVVAAIAESHPERGRAAAEEFKIARVETDYRAVLDDPFIHAVTICLPNCLHAPVSLAALQAGKHVLLEKPMATNAQEAGALVKAARESQRLLMVAQNQRFSKNAQTVRQLVERGFFGDIYYAKAYWRRQKGIPRIGSWFTQRAMAGGGATYDIGVHVLDLCLFLLDEFDVETVSAAVGSRLGEQGMGDGGWGKSEIDPDKPFDVDDFSCALLRLKNGCTIMFEATWALLQEHGDMNGVELYGTAAGGRVGQQPALFEVDKIEDKLVHKVSELPDLPTLVDPNRMAHFVDCLLGRAEPLVPMEQSLQVQRILDAIYLSAQEGREVVLKDMA